MNIYIYIWGWDFNPLVPGWGNRSRENQIPRVFGFALYRNLVFFCFWYRADL